MTDKTSDPFRHIRKLHFVLTERKIAAGEYIAPDDLAELVRRRGENAVPDSVIEHMCAHLAGEIAAPRGRKPLLEIFIRQRNMLIAGEYRRLKTLLAGGVLSPEDEELYRPEASDDVDRPPAERAARLVAGLFLDGPESWRAVICPIEVVHPGC